MNCCWSTAKGSGKRVSANIAAYGLTTGQDGRLHQLVRRIETTGWPVGDNGKVWRHQALCDLDIRPGETTNLVVDGATDASISSKGPAERLP